MVLAETAADFDTCSETPFLFDPTTKNLISYDDITSMTLKSQFAAKMRLAGINVFSSTGFNSAVYSAMRKAL